MKKMKCLGLLMLVSFVFASEYTINDFKADSLNTWQVFMNGNINSRLQNYNNKDYWDNKTTNFYFDPDIRFKKQVLRKNSVWVTDVEASFNYSSSNQERKTYEYENINENFGFTASTDYSKYFSKELGRNIGIKFTNSTYVTDRKETGINEKYSKDIDEDKNTNRYTSFQVTPGIVIGREYNAKYGAKAMEIIDELRNEGLLKRELTKKEYLELSQIILTRQASYHYDSRIKKIEALNEIIGYLRDIDAIDCQEVTPTVIVQDIYSYDLSNVRVPRKTGTEFKLNALLQYENRKQVLENTDKYYSYENDGYSIYAKDVDKNTNKYNIFYGGLQVSFKYNKVVNWNIYYNFGLTAYKKVGKSETNYDFEYKNYDYNNNTKDVIDGDIDHDIKSNVNYLGLYHNFYYQFNSRSFVNINIASSYRNQIEDYEDSEDSDYEVDTEQYSLNITPQYKYYFTPKLYLSGGCSYSFEKYWEKSKWHTQKIFDNYYSFSLGIGYYL